MEVIDESPGRIPWSGARAIVFDMDGVLIHSSEFHDRAFRAVLAESGVSRFDYPRFAGWKTEDVFRVVFKESGLTTGEHELREMARKKSRLAREMMRAERPIAPDCVEVLKTLSDGFTLALASSGSKESVEAFFGMTGTRSLFKVVVTAADVRRAKPNPEIYQRAFAGLGLPAEACLVVEDAVSGVQAARAAGAEVIGVAGTSEPAALLEAGAAVAQPDLRSILRMIVGDVNRTNWNANAASAVTPSNWTAIVAAAGRGTRLNFDPKILYPLAGRTILAWLLDLLLPYFGRLVLVVSPSGRAPIEEEIRRLAALDVCQLVVQKQPTGMADAVEIGAGAVQTPHAAVIWGDQVALKPQSVEAVMRLHEGPLAPDVTCPTVWRRQPYIHFSRNENGTIDKLLQAREKDAMPLLGESDTGFFCFRTDVLRDLLVRLQNAPRGNVTREVNMLHAIPIAAASGRSNAVLTPRIMRYEETIGVNTPAEALAIERFIRTDYDRD